MPLSESTIRQRRLRLENIEALGRYRDHHGKVRSDPRCNNPDCHWRNDDGTLGCNVVEALQFDHKSSGGSSERNDRRDSGLGLQYRVRKQPWRFQLLCANCNWIKRHKNEEARGWYKHLRPKELQS